MNRNKNKIKLELNRIKESDRHVSRSNRRAGVFADHFGNLGKAAKWTVLRELVPKYF